MSNPINLGGGTYSSAKLIKAIQEGPAGLRLVPGGPFRTQHLGEIGSGEVENRHIHQFTVLEFPRIEELIQSLAVLFWHSWPQRLPRKLMRAENIGSFH